MNPNSSLVPYILPNEVLYRKDWRVLAQLCNDDPGTSTAPNNITETQLLTNINFLTIINDACGLLESAVLRSNIYQVSDLQALNGMSQAYMKKILSDIIIHECYARRSGPAMSESVINDYNAAMKALSDLSDGVRIFSFQQTENAGLPTVYQFQPQDYFANNLISARWGRSFGIRQDLRRWGGNGGTWPGGFQ